MERREFITTACGFCLTLSSGLATAGLASCSSYPVYAAERKGNSVLIPLSIFRENALQTIRVRDFEYDIAVHRHNDSAYTALLLMCTHSANRLSSTGAGFSCTLHGSKFDGDGAVLRGPAERPLKILPTHIVGDTIVVTIN